MLPNLAKHLVELEMEKNIKDGFTHQLALSLIHETEAALGEQTPDAAELVRLRRLRPPSIPKRAEGTL